MPIVTHTGSCHCGAITFEFPHESEGVQLTSCNCSMCSRRGFLQMTVEQPDLKLTKGSISDLGLYTFNTHTARHYFCKTCGITPFYIPRSHPHCYSINYGCIHPGTMSTTSDPMRFDGQNWEASVAKFRGEDPK
ncbi:hypothetical protein BOTBODRAFT_361465 [Botryobasidium botryosum FD-172 SS1]|uniref:CENP-V/GFA domain-containing protein n=1 Tax=Botryobasidium botryosum (strain FD-172 SS1) TaxID=930990 RepID=A0A067MQH5_BOTB1|nr:hypothetical protein BOTBODRAFT_361465 [Botryobasidium botryosum FD-172 SS1]